MQIVGIAMPTARYAYTWRGVKRDRDREHSISGVEYLIYDRETLEVLAFRRTFQLAGNYSRYSDKNQTAHWLQGELCPQAANLPSGDERPEWMLLRTLKTIKYSTALDYRYSKDGK